MRFFIILFFSLFNIIVCKTAYAGLGAGPAIHDRNIIPLPKPQTQPLEKIKIRNLNPIAFLKYDINITLYGYL